MVSDRRVVISPKQIHLSLFVRLLLGIVFSALSALLLVFSMPPYGICPLVVIGFYS